MANPFTNSTFRIMSPGARKLAYVAKKDAEPDPVTAFTKDMIRRWLAADEKRTLADLAERMGYPRTSSVPSQLQSDKFGVGQKTLLRVAKGFEMSVPEFTRAAFEWWEREGSRAPVAVVQLVTEFDERYPNRARAIVAARALGRSPSAIAAVASQKLKSDVDLSPDQWLKRIDATEDDEKHPSLTAPSGRRLTDDDDV